MLSIIEAYEPPESKPYDWSTGCATFGDDINAALTAQHGDPTIRTYAGEAAAQYGLKDTVTVLYWFISGSRWGTVQWYGLKIGDQWRKHPAAPQEVTA